jgi:hypothetical protein
MQMHRALQGYEKAIGPNVITTYFPALNSIFNLGLLFEHQADIAKARAMFPKELRGYEQVFEILRTNYVPRMRCSKYCTVPAVSRQSDRLERCVK